MHIVRQKVNPQTQRSLPHLRKKITPKK